MRRVTKTKLYKHEEQAHWRAGANDKYRSALHTLVALTLAVSVSTSSIGVRTRRTDPLTVKWLIEEGYDVRNSLITFEPTSY
jgi:hypothetical protein